MVKSLVSKLQASSNLSLAQTFGIGGGSSGAEETNYSKRLFVFPTDTHTHTHNITHTHRHTQGTLEIDLHFSTIFPNRSQ